jgi:hypothetical protein
VALNDLLEGWRFKLDNPTVLGWSVVGAYAIAAVCCAVRAMRGSPSERRGIWWLLAGALFFLGVNKQLNLQTMLIVVGRNLAMDQGWSNHRRAVQAAFGGVFALAGMAVLAWLVTIQRAFFTRNRLAMAGVAILVCFVALRAATINHVDEFLRIHLADDSWAWILEITGSALIAIEAITGLSKTRAIEIV